MDKLTPERRSQNMRQIKSKGTKPEMLVRSLVHRLGYRYRLHKKDLPGKPDLVFGPRHKVIFVHGCFWHVHEGCIDGRSPKSNRGYWGPKLARNIERDKSNISSLKNMGWEVLVIWECEASNEKALALQLRRFLR